MAISKTSTLMVALFTGFVSLLLQTIALSTDYWTCSTFDGSVKEFYTHNGSVIQPPRSLIRNRGLWRMCEIIYIFNNDTQEQYVGNDSNSGMGNVQMTGTVATSTKDSELKCRSVNFSEVPTHETNPNFFRIIYYCEKTAAIVACVCVGLQFCGFLTSIQGAWTMMTVLFTDCGIMYLFAAIMGLLCMTLFMISFSYETNEVPNEILEFPSDYLLQYGWSFYLAWMAFALTTVSGLLYLLIARAWHMQEVWAEPIKQEKGTSKEESFSYRGKLMPKL